MITTPKLNTYFYQNLSAEVSVVVCLFIIMFGPSANTFSSYSVGIISDYTDVFVVLECVFFVLVRSVPQKSSHS